MKRIVKETDENGQDHYRVQGNTICGVRCKWYTLTDYIVNEANEKIAVDAVYKTIDEAKAFIGNTPSIVKREVVFDETQTDKRGGVGRAVQTTLLVALSILLVCVIVMGTIERPSLFIPLYMIFGLFIYLFPR